MGERLMRACGHPAVMADTVCRWPAGTVVTWYVDTSELTPEAVATIASAIGQWSQVSGVQTQQVADPSQARVLITFEPIDPARVVLGLTELPCDGLADVQHSMKLNVAEDWSEAEIFDVALHEFGHAIGLVHPPDGVRSCMSAYLDMSVSSPQPPDVAAAVLRYGAAVAAAPDPAPQPTPAPVPAVPPTPPSTVSQPSNVESPMLRFLESIFTSAVSSEVGAFVVAELRAALQGPDPLHAIATVNAKIDATIPDPAQAATAKAIVDGLIQFGEQYALKALPAA